MASSITPKALAAQLGTNGKALRRFMRAQADAASKAGKDPRVARVGQGNRYDLSATDAKAIADAWRKAHGQPTPKARAPRKAQPSKAPQAPQAPVTSAADDAPAS